MSVTFVVVPIVYASWPAVAPLTGAVASALGYTAAKVANVVTDKDEVTEEKTETQWELDNCDIMGEQVSLDESLSYTKEDITVTFYKDARGNLSVHVSGTNRSQEELETIGEEFVGQIRQQYAYTKLMEELKKDGFNLVQEEAATDGRIKLTVRKHE